MGMEFDVIMNLEKMNDETLGVIRRMLNHWFNPNKKEKLLTIGKDETMSKLIEGENHYSVSFKDPEDETNGTYRFDLTTPESDDETFLLDRVMNYLLFHPSVTEYIDDLFSMDTMQQLVKNRYNRFVYRYSVPEGKDPVAHAKKIVTLTANLKHQFLMFDTSKASEDECYILLREYLLATKDFYPTQVVNNIKLLMLRFANIKVEDVLPSALMYGEDIMFKCDMNFVMKLFEEAPHLLVNLEQMMGSLVVSMKMFEEDETLDNIRANTGWEIVEHNDPFDEEFKVPAIFQFLLEDAEFAMTIMSMFHNRPVVEMHYYLSENKDYIFSGKNLFKLLNENGLFQFYVKSLETNLN